MYTLIITVSDRGALSRAGCDLAYKFSFAKSYPKLTFLAKLYPEYIFTMTFSSKLYLGIVGLLFS